jgi:hypothetical protein
MQTAAHFLITLKPKNNQRFEIGVFVANDHGHNFKPSLHILGFGHAHNKPTSETKISSSVEKDMGESVMISRLNVFCGKFVGKTYFIGLENKTKYIFVRE